MISVFSDGVRAAEDTSVSPSPARQGDQVTIAGDHFGTTASQVGVTFSSTAGAVVSVTNTSIVATVPPIASGNSAVVVTVAGRTSSSFTLAVLQALPAVTGVNPTSVRAGAALTITGQNFVTLERVRLGGAAVEVLLDDVVLLPQSVTATQIVVGIPLNVTPGSHELIIRRGEDTSAASILPVEIFTVSGTYFLEGVVTFNDCPVDFFPFPQGTDVVSIATVTDNRPVITVALRATEDAEQGFPRPGTLMSDGSFQASISEGGESLTITGDFTLGTDDVPIITGTDVFQGSTCRWQVDFTATRTSTSTSARVPSPGAVLGNDHSLAGKIWGTAPSR